MIYFIRVEADGPIKIGTSEVMSNRMAEHTASIGRPVCVLGVIEGGRDEEQAIHQRFSHLRIGKAPTEWFEPGSDLLAFIEETTGPWDGTGGRPIHNEFFNRKPLAVQMRGSLEWKTWVEIGAKRVGLKVPEVITFAVAQFFKQHGFDEPPPER